MSAIAPQDRNTPAPPKDAAPQHIERAFLAPFRALAEIQANHPHWMEMADAGQITAEEVAANDAARRAAERIVAEVPEGEMLRRCGLALAALAAAAPDRRQNWLIVANMLDGYLNARPNNPAAFIEQMVQDVTVDGFPPCVVARAADAWGRANRFAPSRSEFLEACRAELRFLTSLGDRPIRAADARLSAVNALQVQR